MSKLEAKWTISSSCFFHTNDARTWHQRATYAWGGSGRANDATESHTVGTGKQIASSHDAASPRRWDKGREQPESSWPCRSGRFFHRASTVLSPPGCMSYHNPVIHRRSRCPCLAHDRLQAAATRQPEQRLATDG